MQTEETLIINLNTQGGYAVNVANPAAVVFNLPWASLPRKYSKFSCVINFRSTVYAPLLAAPQGILQDIGVINISFARTNVFDNSMMGGNVAMIYPIVTSTVANNCQSYYACTMNDNAPFIIDYPTSGLTTITLKTLAGAVLPNIANWNLQMSLCGILGPNIGKANLTYFEKPTTF
jgi:hypothetical protein